MTDGIFTSDPAPNGGGPHDDRPGKPTPQPGNGSNDPRTS